MPQNERVTGPFSYIFSALPVKATCSVRKPTKADTGAPLARRQSPQWQ